MKEKAYLADLALMQRKKWLGGMQLDLPLQTSLLSELSTNPKSDLLYSWKLGKIELFV